MIIETNIKMKKYYIQNTIKKTPLVVFLMEGGL